MLLLTTLAIKFYIDEWFDVQPVSDANQYLAKRRTP